MFYVNIFVNKLKHTTSKIVCHTVLWQISWWKHMDSVFLLLYYLPDCFNLSVTRGPRYPIYPIRVKKKIYWWVLSVHSSSAPNAFGEIFGNNIRKQPPLERRITSVKLFALLITVIPSKMPTQSRQYISVMLTLQHAGILPVTGRLP